MAENTKSSNQKKIVILGGSYGGVSTAHYLLKHALPKLSNAQSYQIVLVSTTSETFCRPAAPRAMISDDKFDQKKLFVSIEKSFEPYPKDYFSFIQGTATDLDHINRTVTIKTAGGNTMTIEFYALVIATGASTTSPLLGYTKDEAALKASWASFRTGLPDAKHIVIAGGGAAGVESAGELGESLNGRAGWFRSKLANPKVSITLVTSDSHILPVLPPKYGAAAEKSLAKVGVEVIKNVRVTGVSPEGAGTSDPASKAKITLADGKQLEADLYIPAVGQRPNTSFVKPELLASDGRVKVNPLTLRVETAGPLIYAVGDVADYSRAAIHYLNEAIPVVCANIKSDLLEKKEDRELKLDQRVTHLVPIGKGAAVGAVMGWSMPSFLIWAIKGRDYWLWTTPALWSGKQWDKEA